MTKKKEVKKESKSNKVLFAIALILAGMIFGMFTMKTFDLGNHTYEAAYHKSTETLNECISHYRDVADYAQKTRDVAAYNTIASDICREYFKATQKDITILNNKSDERYKEFMIHINETYNVSVN